LVYGGAPVTAVETTTEREARNVERLGLRPGELPPEVKSGIVGESPSGRGPSEEVPAATGAPGQLPGLCAPERQAAPRTPGAGGDLTGATRELQAGLGSFLQACHENGVKVGPWRLQHVVAEWSFGEHPTYGVISIGHWVCKDGQPWKVGVGLFLGR